MLLQVWILWPHNPGVQSDDRLNDTGKNTAINQLSPEPMPWEWKSHWGTASLHAFVSVHALCVCVCLNTCLSLLHLHNFSYFAEHSLYDCLRTETNGGDGLVGSVLSAWDDFREIQGMYCMCIRASQWNMISPAEGRMDQCFYCYVQVFYRFGFTAFHVNRGDVSEEPSRTNGYSTCHMAA